MTGSNKRIKAERLGRRAEFVAAIALLFKGYRIVAMRYKTRLGEIDLVARKGDLVVIVEVKARKTVQEAIDSVSFSARRRINDAADLWLGEQKHPEKISTRFDIVAVVPWRWPTHFEDAF